MSEELALQETLTVREEHERLRAEMLAAFDAAELSIARGGGRVITGQSMQELASDVKRRGRARLGKEAEMRDRVGA